MTYFFESKKKKRKISQSVITEKKYELFGGKQMTFKYVASISIFIVPV